MQGLISSVKRGSLADAAGIKAGESLLAVNGSSVRDIIDLSFLLADEEVELTLLDAAGNERKVQITKNIDEDLGLEFESAVFGNNLLQQMRFLLCRPDDTRHAQGALCA